MPFEEIAAVVGRSPAAARQLASRARRRVQETGPVPDTNLTRQREAVDAFFAAARGGDFDALLACSIRTSCCDPTAVCAGRLGGGSPSAGLAKQALTFARLPVLRTSTREPSGWSPGGSAWTAVCGDGVPGFARRDRRNQRARRPSAFASSTWRSSTADERTYVPLRRGAGLRPPPRAATWGENTSSGQRGGGGSPGQAGSFAAEPADDFRLPGQFLSQRPAMATHPLSPTPEGCSSGGWSVAV